MNPGDLLRICNTGSGAFYGVKPGESREFIVEKSTVVIPEQVWDLQVEGLSCMVTLEAGDDRWEIAGRQQQMELA